MGIHVRTGFFSALSASVVQYVLSIAGIAVLGFVIDFLAPSFQGKQNQIQAFKVAAYSMTAAWVAGMLNLVPSIALISMLAVFYSLYVLYCGLPILMKNPPEKSVLYTVIVVVVGVLINMFVARLATPAMMQSSMHDTSNYTVSGEVSLPGGVKVDMDTVNKTVQAMLQNSTAVQPIASDVLKGILPNSIAGGFSRSEISGFSGGTVGIKGSTAEGIYQRGTARIRLSIADISGVGFMGALGAFSVESSKETATSYSKTGKVDGRMTTEEFDRTSGRGKYSVVVASRFIIDANGTGGVTIDELKLPIIALIAPLEELAKSKS